MDICEIQKYISAQCAKFSENYERATEAADELERLKKRVKDSGFLVIDEAQSVAWNREMTQKKLEELAEKAQAAERIGDQFEADIRAALTRFIRENYSLSESQAMKVYALAYGDGSEYGYTEILAYCQKYAAFVNDILEEAKK